MSQLRVLVSDLQGGSDDQVKYFVLSASCDAEKWNVKRSSAELRDLHEQLSLSFIAEKLPSLVVDNECSIQQYFDQLLENLSETVWDLPAVLTFLDNVPVKSAISQLHIERLTQKIKELESSTSMIQKTVDDVNQKYDHLMSLINGQSSTGSVSSSSKSADDNWKSSHGRSCHGRERGSKKWMPSQCSIDEGEKPGSASRRKELDDDSSDSDDDDDDDADYFDEEGISASVRPYLLKPSLSSLMVPNAVGQNIFPPNDQLEQYSRMTNEVLRCIQPYDATVQYRNSAISFIKRLIKTATNCNAFDVTLHELRCALPDDIIRVSVIMNKNDGSVNNTWHKSILEKLNLAAERTVTENTSLNMAVRYDDESGGGAAGGGAGGEGGAALPIITHSICNVQLTSNPVNYQVNCLIDNSLPVEIIVNDRIDMVFQAFFEEFSQLVGKDHLFKKSLLLVRAWWIYETSSYVGTSIKHCISDNCITIMLIAVFNQFHPLIESPVQALCMFLTEYSNFDGSSHAITIQGLVPFKDINSNVPVLSSPKPDHLLSPLLIDKYWKIFNVHAPESATVSTSRSVPVDRHATVQDFQVGSDDRSYGHGGMANNSSHHSFNNSTHSFNNGSTHSFPNNSAHSHHSHGFNNNSTHSTHSFNNGSTHSHRSMGFGNDSTHSQHSYHSHTSNHSITNSTACMLFERADFSIVCPFDHTNMMPPSGNYTAINNNRENMTMERLSSKQISLINKAFSAGASALSAIVKHNNKAFASWEERHLSSKTTTLTEDELMKDLLSNINHDVGMTSLLSDTVSSQGSTTLQSGGVGGGSTGGSEVDGLESLVSFFPILMTRLGGTWRPDAVNNTVEQEKESKADLTGILSSEVVKARSANKLRELMTGSLGTIWQNILYTNLILENVLTESALLTLSCEILTDRGPLPVGEIGKMLSEITTFPHFTARLKEKFGGLKKFLENFPHIIYISTDHPFNPNVLLRSSVTPEQLDMIEKGLLPIQSVIKSKKAAITAATAAYAQSKKKGGGGGGGGGGGNNSPGMGAGGAGQMHSMQQMQMQQQHHMQQQQQHSSLPGGIGSLLLPPDDHSTGGLLSYRSNPNSTSSPGGAQGGALYSNRSPTVGAGASAAPGNVSLGYATAVKSPPLAHLNQQLHLQQQQQQQQHQHSQQQQIQQQQQQSQSRRNLSGNAGFNAVPGSFGGQYYDVAPEEDFAIGSAGAYQLLGQRGGGGAGGGGNSELSALRENSYELGGYGVMGQNNNQKRQQLPSPPAQQHQQLQHVPQYAAYGLQQQPPPPGMNQNNTGYRSNRMY